MKRLFSSGKTLDRHDTRGGGIMQSDFIMKILKRLVDD